MDVITYQWWDMNLSTLVNVVPGTKTYHNVGHHSETPG